MEKMLHIHLLAVDAVFDIYSHDAGHLGLEKVHTH